MVRAAVTSLRIVAVIHFRIGVQGVASSNLAVPTNAFNVLRPAVILAVPLVHINVLTF